MVEIDSLLRQAIEKANESFKNGDYIYTMALLEQAKRVGLKNKQADHMIVLCLRSVKRLKEAAERIVDLVSEPGASWEMLNTAGMVFSDLWQWQKSIGYFNDAIKLKPDSLILKNNLALSLNSDGQRDKAIEILREVRKTCDNPTDAANIEYNMGNIYLDMLHPKESALHHKNALELNPSMHNAKWNLSCTQLGLEEYESGWKNYEARWNVFDHLMKGRESLKGKSQWQGEYLDGKSILLFSEQGAGDMIQFVRFAKLLKQDGATVIVEWPKQSIRGDLTTILENLPFIDQVVDMCDNTKFDRFDYWSSVASLPGLLKLNDASQLTSPPYINVNNAPSSYEMDRVWKQYKKYTKIGLVWAGSQLHSRDRERSESFAQFRKIISLIKRRVRKPIQFFSLQTGELKRNYPDIGVVDLGDGLERSGVTDLSPTIIDYESTASILNRIDLLISVDTAIVHLAGAMGKPTIVLTTRVPDWRWGFYKDKCAWYDSVHIVRKTKDNDENRWENVAAKAAEILPFS